FQFAVSSSSFTRRAEPYLHCPRGSICLVLHFQEIICTRWYRSHSLFSSPVISSHPLFSLLFPCSLSTSPVLSSLLLYSPPFFCSLFSCPVLSSLIFSFSFILPFPVLSSPLLSSPLFSSLLF